MTTPRVDIAARTITSVLAQAWSLSVPIPPSTYPTDTANPSPMCMTMNHFLHDSDPTADNLPKLAAIPAIHMTLNHVRQPPMAMSPHPTAVSHLDRFTGFPYAPVNTHGIRPATIDA